MAPSILRVRPVDGATGALLPDLARRVSIYRDWDLDRVTRWNPVHVMGAKDAPRKLVGDEIEFELSNETAWLCRTRLHDLPPGMSSRDRWLIVEPGSHATVDLPIDSRHEVFEEPHHDRAELVRNDMPRRRTYGGLLLRISFPSRPGGHRAEDGIIYYEQDEISISLASQDSVTYRCHPFACDIEGTRFPSDGVTLERLIAPAPPGHQNLSVCSIGSSVWTGTVDIKAGETLGPVLVELVPGPRPLDLEVIDTEGRPIPAAFVQVSGRDPGLSPDNLIMPVGRGWTGRDGRVRLKGLRDDILRVSFHIGAPGYQTKSGAAEVSAGPIRVTLAREKPDTGFVAGRVLDHVGAPAGGVGISAFSEETLEKLKNPNLRPLSPDGNTTTGGDGRFRIEGLDHRWEWVYLVPHCQGYKHIMAKSPMNRDDVEVRLETEI